MVIVINSKGGLVSQQVEDLFQGSSKANIINVIAPFSSNIVFRANFEMPDGTILPEDKSGYIFKPSIKVVDGLNMWKLPIEFPITQNYGVVSMQLRAMMGEEILCTTTVKFPIQKGVPYDSEHVEQGTYDAILQMIADVRALLNNKVDIKNYNYKVAENVDKDTIGAYYIYDNKNDEYKVVLLPEKYNASQTYYRIETEGTIANRNDGIYISFQKNNKKGEIAVKETGVYINNKQVVVFDDLVAENIVYDNTSGQLKAEDVKSALDELSNDFRNVKNSQVFDLGTRTIESMSWIEENGVYKYKFTHEYLVDEKTQSIIITPNDEAIDNLNNNDILIYPQIDIVNVDNTVYAIVSADKKPNFDIVAEFKLQGVSATNETPNITASYVSFNAVENVNANNVQEAIGKVQQNIDSYINDNKENIAFVENEREKQVNKLCLADNYSYTHNGVVLTQTKDRITINGKSTQDETELVVKLLDNNIVFKANETYTLSFQNVENGIGFDDFTFYLYYKNNQGISRSVARSFGESGINAKTFSVDTDCVFEKIVIRCDLNSSVTNASVNVQLEKGEDWTEFRLAEGDIVNIGDNVTRFAESERQKSKNLFNKYGSLSDHIGWTSGTTILQNNGTIKATSNMNNGNGKGQFINVIPNANYTISFDVLEKEATGIWIVSIISVNSDGTAKKLIDYGSGVTGKFNYTFTPITDKIWVSFNGISNPSDITLFKYVIYDNFQLEEGVQATDYQAYNGEIVHNGDASVIFAERERQKSKNLLTLEQQDYTAHGITVKINKETQELSFNGNGNTVNEGRIAYVESFTLKAGRTYTFSFSKVSGSRSGGLFVYLYNTATGEYTNTFGITLQEENKKATTLTPTTDLTFNAMRWYIDTGTSTTNYTVKLQVEEDTQATNWQYPYGAIVHEKDVAGIVRIETIYNMDTTFENKTTVNGISYTSGIVIDNENIVQIPIDTTKYKKVTVWLEANVHPSGWFSDGAQPMIIDLQQTKITTDTQYSSSLLCAPNFTNFTADIYNNFVGFKGYISSADPTALGIRNLLVKGFVYDYAVTGDSVKEIKTSNNNVRSHIRITKIEGELIW